MDDTRLNLELFFLLFQPNILVQKLCKYVSTQLNFRTFTLLLVQSISYSYVCITQEKLQLKAISVHFKLVGAKECLLV